MTLAEELALVARAQTGDRAALGLLIDDITPKLYGYLVNTLRNQELADDCLQTTWPKAICALPRLRSRGVRFSAWLFAIARNVCREHWRQSHHEPPLPETPPDQSDNSATAATLQETILVDAIIKQLSPPDQEILRLRYLADLTFKDIAAVLEIAPLAARLRAHRALTRARAILNRS